MRVTNSVLLRGYNRNLNRLTTAKNKVEKKITTTRKFSRASEAPLAAAKALNVRKSLYYSTQYQENLKTANKFYTEAETSLLQVSEKMAQVREELVAACNTTKDQQEYAIYSQHLETIARELVAIFNTDSAGRGIFGGHSDDTLPFSIINDENGFAETLTYHGVPINSMSDPMNFPYSDPVTIDVGLGMAMNQETQEVDYQTVMDISFNGAKITGCGAEKATADIDLDKIVQDKTYRIDVYAGNIKKTIEFTGQATKDATVLRINDLMAAAFQKDVAYGRIPELPKVEAKTGIFYCTDANDNTANVCVVNNTYSGTSREIITDVSLNLASDPPEGFEIPGHPVAFRYSYKKADATKNYAAEVGITNDSGYTDKFRVNFNALEAGKTYTIDVTRGDDTKTISFLADANDNTTIANIQSELDTAFGTDMVVVSKNPVTKGMFTAEGVTVSAVDSLKMLSTNVIGANVSSTTPGVYTVDIAHGITKDSNGAPSANLQDGDEVSMLVTYNGRSKIVQFIKRAGDDAGTYNSLQGALIDAFGSDGVQPNIKVDNAGNITLLDSVNNTLSVTTVEPGTRKDPAVAEREEIFSNNYIQLTIDAARALRNGDIEYANGCIDRIVEANEHLLVQIADLGCNEDFIDFNLERLTTRDYNLKERQNDLEMADLEYETTLLKQYEALYNMCLQMASMTVPNSIFNYIS